jgi:hypothetical protein
MYAEVEILVASNRRPVVDKTLIASNLESITVSSNIGVLLFYTRFKITTHKIRSFDDILLFSIRPKMLKMTRTAKRENSSEFYLLIAML